MKKKEKEIVINYSRLQSIQKTAAANKTVHMYASDNYHNVIPFFLC